MAMFLGRTLSPPCSNSLSPPPASGLVHGPQAGVSPLDGFASFMLMVLTYALIVAGWLSNAASTRSRWSGFGIPRALGEVRAVKTRGRVWEA